MSFALSPVPRAARGLRWRTAGAAAATTVVLFPAVAVAAPQDRHRVQPGETLSEIALRYGIGERDLARANGLGNPNRIISGKSLIVSPGSSAAPPGASHVVAAGETLSSVAARYGTTFTALASANGIQNPHRIVAGTRLRVPAGVAASSATSAANAETVLHTIAPGQTLTAIAARYRVPASAIADANDLQSRNHIVAGATLRIPVTGRPTAGAATRDLVQRLLEEGAGRHGWDPNLIKAISWQESGWNNDAISSVGAVGIMQVLPSTNRDVSERRAGRSLDLNDPFDNIEAGMQYLELLDDLTGGDAEKILAGYYQGLRSVRQNGLYPSTERYIDNIMALRDRFAATG